MRTEPIAKTASRYQTNCCTQFSQLANFQKKFDWRPLAPTSLRNQPFGKCAEGFFDCVPKSCAIKAKFNRVVKKSTDNFGESCEHGLPIKIACAC
jgi:hypothetical protein